MRGWKKICNKQDERSTFHRIRWRSLLPGLLALSCASTMACVCKEATECLCKDPTAQSFAVRKIASDIDPELAFSKQLLDEVAIAPPSAVASAPPPPPDPAVEARRVHEAAFDDPLNDQKLMNLMAILPMVGGKFVVEGDMLMDSDDLRDYLKARKGITEPGDNTLSSNGGRLIVKTWGGTPDYWRSPQNRKMVYAVNANTFDSSTQYDEVVANFAEACRTWEQACPSCGVSFAHDRKRDHDDERTLVPSSSQGSGKLTFVVRHKKAEGTFVATSFFPHFAVRNRYVNIDAQYFTTEYDHVGVFIHEIGHILGYLHEHIRASTSTLSGCYKEKNSWKPLTNYDPKSAMHYWCDGGGTFSLNLTDLDIEGHKLLYLQGKWL